MSIEIYSKWTKPKKFDRNLIVIGAGGLVTRYIPMLLRDALSGAISETRARRNMR